jgi:hypothetical protein
LFTSTALALPVGSSSEHDWSLVARQEGNPQRELFCRYNQPDCQTNHPEYCTDPNSPKYPAWCAWSNPDPQPPAKTPVVDSTSLVARQEGNPQRQLHCRYNPGECQLKFPEYCTDPNSPTYPDWCAWTNPDPPSALNRRALEDAIDTHLRLVSRQDPNDTPEEIYQMRKEFCMDDPQYCEKLCEYSAQFCYKFDQEEEEEETNETLSNVDLVQRAPQDEPDREDPEEEDPPFCKRHPKHPFCLPPFSVDNPGRFKEGVEVTGAVESSVEPSTPSSSAVMDSSVFRKRDKKGGWYCYWLC